MLCVHNNIVCTVGQKRIIALVLLDLSAVFDTVDHTTLLTLTVLQWWFGACNMAMAWLQLYLSDHTQKFLVDDLMSLLINVNYRVP